MADTPTCSVLICTYNRAELLRLTLESLCAQSVGPKEFETVVVDDGSADDTATVVERFTGRLRLRYEYQRNSGLAAARNHAVLLARAPIVILQDDDDLAGPHLVAEHLTTHARHPEAHTAALGFTNLSAALRRDPLMHFVTEVGQFLFSYPGIRHGQVLDYSYFWGGRSSCKRSLLLEHGLFDPVFRFGCEDIELGYRLSKIGFRVVYNSRAISTTVRPFTVEGFCKRLYRQGRSNYIFSQLHPEPEVQRWTEVVGAQQRWDEISPAYEALLRTARHLDADLRARLEQGLDAGRSTRLLHQAYWAAFSASKVKGIAERARECDGTMPDLAQMLSSSVANDSHIGALPPQNSTRKTGHLNVVSHDLVTHEARLRTGSA